QKNHLNNPCHFHSGKTFFILFFCAVVYAGFSLFGLRGNFSPDDFEYLPDRSSTVATASTALVPPTHVKTPESVKAIYMTSWVAGTTDWRNSMVKLIEETELNSLIIDVKDYTGRISFKVSDPTLKEIGSEEIRIPDIREFLNHLHTKNIYVIARISVFQDPYMVKERPDLAVKRGDGLPWKDYKGISWIDPASHEMWDYIIRVARESERVGFDELNFDYIRFPSDGNMKDMEFDFWDETTPKSDTMKEFYAYLSKGLKDVGVPISADLFGMTTWNDDDLNIGQILEDAALYFDYIAPMVYPSHYPTGFQGFHNPAMHPYEIVKSAMERGSEKLLTASSSPNQLRPWLQDFDMGATYTAEMVKKQMQAVYDAGLTSWMLWAPSNRYTHEALSEI
ncbi:putative glycoside hydrolase, partial [Patescibacteria group bacterium]